MQLCGLVAVEELSEGKVKIFGKYPIRVGRRDNDKSGKGFSTLAPENTLPPADMTAPDFKKWWGDRSFGVELAIALLGTHALIDHQVSFWRWRVARAGGRLAALPLLGVLGKGDHTPGRCFVLAAEVLHGQRPRDVHQLGAEQPGLPQQPHVQAQEPLLPGLCTNPGGLRAPRELSKGRALQGR